MNQDVVWLQVAVHYASVVTVLQTSEDLLDDTFQLRQGHSVGWLIVDACFKERI
jgi:malonyl CoA-acyl carrier protein transacylase